MGNQYHVGGGGINHVTFFDPASAPQGVPVGQGVLLDALPVGQGVKDAKKALKQARATRKLAKRARRASERAQAERAAAARAGLKTLRKIAADDRKYGDDARIVAAQELMSYGGIR